MTVPPLFEKYARDLAPGIANPNAVIRRMILYDSAAREGVEKPDPNSVATDTGQMANPLDLADQLSSQREPSPMKPMADPELRLQKRGSLSEGSNARDVLEKGRSTALKGLELIKEKEGLPVDPDEKKREKKLTAIDLDEEEPQEPEEKEEESFEERQRRQLFSLFMR